MSIESLVKNYGTLWYDIYLNLLHTGKHCRHTKLRLNVRVDTVSIVYKNSQRICL